MMTNPDSTTLCPEQWDSNKIRDLVRREHMDGHHPTRLLLGRKEAETFRSFLAECYDDDPPTSLRDTYFLGLKVEETLLENQLALVGEKRHPVPGSDLSPIGDHCSAAEQQEPDFTIPSELRLFHRWDSAALRDLIDHKTENNRKPAFLFLGKHEAFLLRRHLKAAFGPESVRTLKNLYYMGLEVVEVETDYFLRTAGMKRVKSFRDLTGHQPRWKDIASGSLWQYSTFG